jgi:6-pyruvoyltetrahydropterin/6-carboxytetrahydropterin synthase
MPTIELTHSIDAAHRVYGHEGGRGKCARLHGHTYTVRVSATSPTTNTPEGFVIDFAKIKDVINAWDHRTLLWDQDPMRIVEDENIAVDNCSVIRMPFNPTSENLSKHLAEQYIAMLPAGSRVLVEVSETPKSKALCELRSVQAPPLPAPQFLGGE